MEEKLRGADSAPPAWIGLTNKCTKYELHLTQNAKLLKDVLVAMATRLFVGSYCPNEKCTKYELNLTSECKVIDGCSCCYGEKVSMATSSFMDFDRSNKRLYQL